MSTPPRTDSLSGWQLTALLLIYSAGVSIAVAAAALTGVAAFDLPPAIVGLAALGVMLALHTLLFRGLAARWSRLALALTYLRENRPVTELPARRADPLRPVTEAVNALIRERADLKAMRGQLVEQITAAAAQEERNRLARDLHDSIKQQVFSMSISAAAAYAHLDTNPQAARAALIDVRQSAQEAMVEMRALLQQLSPAPLEKSGLVQALREQCEALSYRTGARVETHFGDLPGDDRLLPGTQEALFRIAQEALSNIARHARAAHVRLSLDTDEADRLALRIADDGQGFDPAQIGAGMGLSNIRSRAAGIGAAVDLASRVGEGAVLTVIVPLIEDSVEDSDMQAHYEAQLKPVISHYYRFSIGLAAAIVALSMLTWRLLRKPEGITEDVVLMVILGALAVALVIGVPVALWSVAKARPQAAALILSAGSGSRVDYRLRRNLRVAYVIVCVAAAWFLPILAIGLGVAPWLRVAVGVFFFALVVWNYARAGDFYRRELALMTPPERTRELDTRLREVRYSWWITVAQFVLILFTTLTGGGIRIPPEVPDHWMNGVFLSLACMLLANQVISRHFYRRWRDGAL